ncbi:hypothetical protein B0H19DRAFT_1155201, partial [Mycena capillaripes]
SLRSDPPVGIGPPTFADLCRGMPIPVDLCRPWPITSAYARSVHVRRSRPMVVCLVWPTLV